MALLNKFVSEFQLAFLRFKEPDHSHFLINEANAYDPAELCCGQDSNESWPWD